MHRYHRYDVNEIFNESGETFLFLVANIEDEGVVQDIQKAWAQLLEDRKKS